VRSVVWYSMFMKIIGITMTSDDRNLEAILTGKIHNIIEMNIIGNDLRNRLLVPKLSDLMFVILVGPSLEEFQPLPYVKQCPIGGHHAACDNQSKKCKKESRGDLRYGHLYNVFK